MKNIIILGHGRTGSSLLAGLIAYNRYYVNLEKIKSRPYYPDGDYENPELIELNKRIFQSVGYNHEYVKVRSKPNIVRISNLAKHGEVSLYKDFIKKCNNEGPWLWKDPRLCYTIYFWINLLDLNDIKFIFTTREPYQIFRSYSKYWINYTKKQIYERVKARIIAVDNFLAQNNIDALRIDYSEFNKIDELIKKLNSYLEINIKKDDFHHIKKSDLKKKESNLHFWLRYYFGLFKLFLAKVIKLHKYYCLY